MSDNWTFGQEFIPEFFKFTGRYPTEKELEEAEQDFKNFLETQGKKPLPERKRVKRKLNDQQQVILEISLEDLSDREKILYAAEGRLFYAFEMQQGFPVVDDHLKTEEFFILLGIEAFKQLDNEPEYNPFEHPFADGIKKVEVNGQEVDTINSWTFAALILETLCDPLASTKRPGGLANAIALFRKLLDIANNNIDGDELLKRCQHKDEAALKQAQTLIASGLTMFISEKKS